MSYSVSHEARAGEPGDWLPTLSGVWLAMGYTVVHAALLLLAQRRTDVPAYVWIVDCVILVATVLFVARAGELRHTSYRSASWPRYYPGHRRVCHPQ